MEVHPPHQPIHSWRDFFVHLLTITIGLLIALSLEATVEWFHHRHLVHEARGTIYRELSDNRKLLADDLQGVGQNKDRIGVDISRLVRLRNGDKIENTSLEYHMEWSSFADAAWRTAQATGALTFMDYQTAQSLAELYEQQYIVSAKGRQIFDDQTHAIAPVFITGDPKLMSKEEIQLTLQRSADLLLAVRGLEQLLAQLDTQLADELKTEQEHGF